jgi:hypothetical protein
LITEQVRHEVSWTGEDSWTDLSSQFCLVTRTKTIMTHRNVYLKENDSFEGSLSVCRRRTRYFVKTLNRPEEPIGFRLGTGRFNVKFKIKSLTMS